HQTVICSLDFMLAARGERSMLLPSDSATNRCCDRATGLLLAMVKEKTCCYDWTWPTIFTGRLDVPAHGFASAVMMGQRCCPFIAYCRNVTPRLAAAAVILSGPSC
ncbi:hypothetical protein ACLOJK_028670, partial [Asimina triloba]